MDRLTATSIKPIKISQIARILNAIFDEKKDQEVSSFCTLFPGEPGGISFLAKDSYIKRLKDTKASVVIINEKQICTDDSNSICLRVKNPYQAWGKLLSELGSPIIWSNQEISKSSNVHKSAKIAKNVVIGENVLIGENVVIHPNVTIYPNSIIEKNCIIHSGAVIGADGLGLHYPKIRRNPFKRFPI